MYGKHLVLIAASIAITACSSHSSNLQIGAEQSYASLRDQREAVRTVEVVDALPQGASNVAPITSGRCHRSFVEGEPTEAMVVNDLRVAAYAQGADGIAEVKVTKESGLSRNCWYILNGSAKAFRLKAQ